MQGTITLLNFINFVNIHFITNPSKTIEDIHYYFNQHQTLSKIKTKLENNVYNLSNLIENDSGPITNNEENKSILKDIVLKQLNKFHLMNYNE